MDELKLLGKRQKEEEEKAEQEDHQYLCIYHNRRWLGEPFVQQYANA